MRPFRLAGLALLAAAALTACGGPGGEAGARLATDCRLKRALPAPLLTHEHRLGEYRIPTYEARTRAEAVDCVQISRRGRVVHAQAAWRLQVEGLAPPSSAPGRLVLGRDITGEGKPNLVVSEWPGGAHCCYRFHVFELGPRFRKAGVIDAGHSDEPAFVDVDGDGRLEFVAHDWTFASWRASFAESPAPVVIFRYHRGAYRPAPHLMRTPAPDQSALAERARGVLAQAAARGGEPPSSLWGVMLELLYTGHADAARDFFELAWPPGRPGREAFLAAFRARLRASPYWPEVRRLGGGRAWREGRDVR